MQPVIALASGLNKRGYEALKYTPQENENPAMSNNFPFVPFELLFPGLAAVIYHGGTGTMAAAARAGIPQAAFPCRDDQFDNCKQMASN